MEAIFDYQPWRLGHEDQTIKLVQGHHQGKGLIAKLEGIDDRDQALVHMDAEISVPRDQLPEPDSGEYYWEDLIGLKVVNLAGIELGQVRKMMATGANDVMVVRGDRERLLPFVQGLYVENVDIEQGWIRVDWNPED